jgi:hypothetical protein
MKRRRWGPAILKMRIVVSTVCSVFLALCCGIQSRPVVPPVQEKETDPQPIAEWCAGPKQGEDDQHRIVDGWDALLRKCGRDSREFYPDLHFVRDKPITLAFRADFHVWCWAAAYVVGLKNNRWANQNSVKDATDLVMDAFIYVWQGKIFDSVLDWDLLRDAKKNYPGL